MFNVLEGIMNKIIISLALCFSSMVCANALAFQWFTDKADAVSHCAIASQIKFTADRPTDPSSQGVLTGDNLQAVKFISMSKVMAPKDLQNINIDYYDNPADNAYGYISGSKITCFYQYQGLTTLVFPVMRSQ